MTVDETAKTVTVASELLGDSDVTITNSSDYTLKTGNGVTAPQTTAAAWKLDATTATYNSASSTAGYTLSDDSKTINYTAAVTGSALVSVTGIGDTSKLTINTETKVVNVAADALASGVTTVSVTSGDYKLERGDGMSAVTTTAAGWTLSDTTATYKDEGKTAGYTVASDGKSITHSSAVEGNTLVTVTGVKSVAGLTLENTTVTVGTASLNEKNVTISAGYNLALAEGISAPTYTSEGFTTVSGNSSTYQTANNTAGYTLANNAITYTAAVAANNLVTVSNINSTDGLTFDSTTNVLTIANNFADVATVTNDSSNNITVTNGSYSAPLAASKSLIAGANWSYQDSTLYIGGSTLTNVGGITNSTTGISLSDGTLTLPKGVTINPSDVDNPSVVTGSSITSVMADGIPYNVEENNLVLAVTDFDVRKIEFDGTTITLFNVDGQKIPESKITKSDYATASNGILTLQTSGKTSNITVLNTGSENFKVTDSSFIAGLASGGTITGIGGSLTGSESWLYSGTTLSANLDSGKLTEIHGLNNLATVTTAKNVSIETVEQGTFNFPNGIYQISGDENVVFVTDANSNVKSIGELIGTLTSNQNNVTINGAALYTSNTDVSVISAGVGIGTVRGLASSDTVTAPTDTSVIMPAESVLDINGASYSLTSDNDGIIITGNNIVGLAPDARLIVSEANNYVVNNTGLDARAGDIIIGDREGTAHIYEPTDVDFTSDTGVNNIVNKLVNGGATDDSSDDDGSHYIKHITDSGALASLPANSSLLNGNLDFTISVDETSEEQTVDFSQNTGIKKTTLKDGIQIVTFNNEGGNIAIVDDGATGDKSINLGNGGDIAVIGNTDAAVNVKSGRGSDQIVSSADNISVDLTAGGATKITATRGTVELTGYDAATGASIQMTKSNIKEVIRNNVITLDNGTIRYGSTSINIDSNTESEGSNVVNFFNLKGERTKVAFTYSGGGTINQSESKESLLMVSTGNSSVTGGSGNDVAMGGAGDYFDLGSGNNSVYLNDNRNIGENSTINQTATSGRTQVYGFNFGFGDSGDRIRIDVSSANVSYRNEQLIFGYMSAQLILSNASSADVAESGDVGDEGSSQKVLVNDGVKLEVAAADTAIRVSSDSEDRATAFVGDNSGINLSDVEENINVNLNAGVGSFGSNSVTFRGINKLQGGTGNNSLIGSAYENNTIVAGVGNTSMWRAGAGNDWLVGSTSTVKSGSTSFFFADGDGHDTITNFEFLTSENRNTADKVDTYGGLITGAKVAGNDVIIEFSNMDDRLTVKEGRGKNIKVGDNLVAQVNVDLLNYDGQANYFMATGKNATVTANESLTSADIWLNNGNFAGDIKYLSAASVGKATLAGNTVDNVITAAQSDSSMWGAGSSNDTLIGGNGADMFRYGLTDGHDVIQNVTSDDVINLYDVTLEDVASAEVTASAIQITTTTGNSLTVESRNSGAGFRLSDGTTWTVNQNTREWVQRI